MREAIRSSSRSGRDQWRDRAEISGEIGSRLEARSGRDWRRDRVEIRPRSVARSGRDWRREAHLRQSMLKVVGHLEQRRAHPRVDPKRHPEPCRVHVRQHGALERDRGATGAVLKGHQPHPEGERHGEHTERRGEQRDRYRKGGQGGLEPCPRLHARAKHGVGLERCRGQVAHSIRRTQTQSDAITCNRLQSDAIRRNQTQSAAIRRKSVVRSPRCNLRAAISHLPSSMNDSSPRVDVSVSRHDRGRALRRRRRHPDLSATLRHHPRHVATSRRGHRLRRRPHLHHQRGGAARALDR